MNGLLLDTNVISELRKPPSRVDSAVRDWASAIEPWQTFISVVTIFELERGVQEKTRKDRAQGRRLRTWLDNEILPRWDGRVLSVDVAVAQIAAGLFIPDPRPWADALIAATALHHGLTVATRNTPDFQPLGVSIVNPWARR